MSQFNYENLSDEEFESLVIRICKEILGIGCKTFSVGRDGAKDSWFSGTAQAYPSVADPWTGTFNIQAKHTKTINASCADNTFLSNRTSTLNKEINRLKEILSTGPFQNYILFTNRKLPGEAHPTIVTMLQNGLNIKNVDIIGRQQIDTYLTDYPQIADKFGLYKFITPLRFYEKDLRDIIVVFDQHRQSLTKALTSYITNFTVIDKDEKNKLNNLSQEYFDFIKNHSLQYFDEIESFLRDPKNDKYTRMYGNTISDLQEAIIIERNRFDEFDLIIKYLVEYLISNNEDKLLPMRHIVRVFVHFMYFNCDIGKTA